MGTTDFLGRLLVASNLSHIKLPAEVWLQHTSGPQGRERRARLLLPGIHFSSWGRRRWDFQACTGSWAAGEWRAWISHVGWRDEDAIKCSPPRSPHSAPTLPEARKDQWREWIRKSLPGLFLLPPHLGLEISGWQLCWRGGGTDMSMSALVKGALPRREDREDQPSSFLSKAALCFLVSLHLFKTQGSLFRLVIFTLHAGVGDHYRQGCCWHQIQCYMWQRKRHESRIGD